MPVCKTESGVPYLALMVDYTETEIKKLEDEAKAAIDKARTLSMAGIQVIEMEISNKLDYKSTMFYVLISGSNTKVRVTLEDGNC